MTNPLPADVTLRHDLRPGDLGQVVWLHGALYAREYGFDPTFEAYVAGPLADFVIHGSGRLWVAERGGELVGCIAVVAASAKEGQLRWYLVAPAARGLGLGRRLLDEAVAFARKSGHESLFLWTVDALKAAAHLYRAAGFEKVEAVPARRWGVEVVEEKYVLGL